MEERRSDRFWVDEWASFTMGEFPQASGENHDQVVVLELSNSIHRPVHVIDNLMDRWLIQYRKSCQ